MATHLLAYVLTAHDTYIMSCRDLHAVALFQDVK